MLLIAEAGDLPGSLTPEPEGNGRNQGEQDQSQGQSVMFENHWCVVLVRVQEASERGFLSSTPKAPM